MENEDIATNNTDSAINESRSTQAVAVDLTGITMTTNNGQGKPGTGDLSTAPVSYSDERKYTEDLLNKRFGYFLTIFTLLVASLTSIKSYTQFLIVLIAGSFIELCLWLSIGRTQLKLQFYTDQIKEDPLHPYTVATAAADKTNSLFRWSFNRLTGKLLPTLIIVVLLLTTIWSCINRQVYTWAVIKTPAADTSIVNRYVLEELVNTKQTLATLQHTIDSMQHASAGLRNHAADVRATNKPANSGKTRN